MSLLSLFMTRHREIERRVPQAGPDFSGLGDVRNMRIDLACPAGEFFRTVLGLPDTNFTSWLPGMPLAALLVTGRRITIDLAPHFLLSYRHHYGIPETALVDFARAGMLLINIRDFDPMVSDESKRAERAARYEPWAELIERLFEYAPHSIYFLAALRPRVFDAIPSFGGPRAASKPSLVSVQQIAATDLSAAAAAANRLSDDDNYAVRAIFRSERTAAVATYWHWAYVQSISRFVEPEFGAYLQTEYNALANFASDVSAPTAAEIGRRFLDFQMRMRFAHLVYSAPISASFGGPYGYSLEDDHIFMQAVERQFRWTEETPFEYDYFEDDLLDLIQDLQVGRLRPRFATYLNGRHWELLKSIGTEVYARTEPQPYFVHYDDPTNRAEFIDFWNERATQRRSYAGLDAQADALLGRAEGITPRDLYDLAALREEERRAANSLLRKRTEGYQVVFTPPPGRRRTSCEVAATDPKEANILMRVLTTLGLQRGNEDAAVGTRGDHARTAYSAGRTFRDNPS